MSKISLIIKREYTTRVMKKSFILLTLLTPLLFVGMIFMIVWLSGIKDDKIKKIAVIDNTQQYKNVLKSNESYLFEYVDAPIEMVKKQTSEKSEYTALLHITNDLTVHPDAATLYSDKQVNMELKAYVAGCLRFLVGARLA